MMNDIARFGLRKKQKFAFVCSLVHFLDTGSCFAGADQDGKHSTRKSTTQFRGIRFQGTFINSDM